MGTVIPIQRFLYILSEYMSKCNITLFCALYAHG